MKKQFLLIASITSLLTISSANALTFDEIMNLGKDERGTYFSNLSSDEREAQRLEIQESNNFADSPYRSNYESGQRRPSNFADSPYRSNYESGQRRPSGSFGRGRP